MRLDAIKLQAKINRMEELYLQILDELRKNRKFNSKTVNEYKDLKKEILLSLYHEPIHHMEDRYFPEVRRALQKLTLDGDPYLPPEIDSQNDNLKEFHQSFRKVLDIDLSNEIEQLASDEFYSWFSGEDYVLNKIKGQLLILQAERLPQFLLDYVDEIRECFTFQQYIAAFVLCRTVFEIAVRDLTQKRQLLSSNSKDWHYVEGYIKQQLEKNNRSLKKYVPTLEVYIDLLSLVPPFKKFKNEMHNLRIEGNRVVHANKNIGKSECQKMVKDTFWLIHELYEIQ